VGLCHIQLVRFAHPHGSTPDDSSQGASWRCGAQSRRTSMNSREAQQQILRFLAQFTGADNINDTEIAQQLGLELWFVCANLSALNKEGLIEVITYRPDDDMSTMAASISHHGRLVLHDQDQAASTPTSAAPDIVGAFSLDKKELIQASAQRRRPMLNPEEISVQQELLAEHRRRLAIFLRQRARLGAAHASPGVLSGIEDARADIARVKEILRANGVSVDDHPDDEEPAARAVPLLSGSRTSKDVQWRILKYLGGTRWQELKTTQEIADATGQEYDDVLIHLDILKEQGLVEFSL
jgi:hypothetical protein